LKSFVLDASICFTKEIADEPSSKRDLGIADEDVPNPLVGSLPLLVEQVLISDLDIEVLVLKILGDHQDPLLGGKFPSFLCTSAEIIVIFGRECGNPLPLKQSRRDCA
jgi:hypothetical protein